jgi:flagella basal body P-ring formation protein FlgA
MKKLYFLIIFLVFSNYSLWSEEIYIEGDTLFLEHIIGAKIKETVLSDLNIGDRIVVPKERIRSILYKMNLLDKYSEYIKDYTVIRKGTLLKEDEIKKLVINALRKNFPDMEFKVEKISYNNNIYYQDKDKIKITFPKLDFGSTYININNGFKTYNLYAYIRAFKETYVAQTNIENNMPLKGRVDMGLAEVTNNYNNLVKGVDNLVSRKTIKEGEPILNQYTKEKPDLKRNSSVRIVYKSKYITVETTGILKQDAFINKAVKVENPTSRKIISAKYIGNGVAVVN